MQKKFFILGDGVDPREIYTPNHAQMQSAVLPIDFRYKHRGRIATFGLWAVRRPMTWVALILMIYAVLRSW
jgi:hypothetical protein